MQLGLHVGSEQLEWGLSQTLWTVGVLLVGLPCLSSVRKDVPSITKSSCAGVRGYSQARVFCSEEKRTGDGESIVYLIMICLW